MRTLRCISFHSLMALSLLLCAAMAVLWLWPSRVYLESGRWTLYIEFGRLHLWNSTRSSWVNFEANAARVFFCCLLLSVLLFMPNHIRTRRAASRVKSGLCPCCGYDLRATPERCPECGMQATVIGTARMNAD